MSEPVLVTATPKPFAYITRKVAIAEVSKAMAEGFATLSELFGKAGAEMAGMPMAHYLEYDDSSTSFELGFPVRPDQVEALRAAGLGIGETPAGEVMQAVHIGPYDSLVTTYDRMMAAMKEQGLTATKDMWETYFSPPETPPDEIRTEVIWPVSRTT